MPHARTGETPYNQRHQLGAVIALGYCKSVSQSASRMDRFTQHDNLPLGLPHFHPICAESTYKTPVLAILFLARLSTEFAPIPLLSSKAELKPAA
jgi:hypothetical protein